MISTACPSRSARVGHFGGVGASHFPTRPECFSGLAAAPTADRLAAAKSGVPVRINRSAQH
ncbi:hypothetical protein AB0P07_27180 [Streptomyces sp. NPDC085944]|uniref:hypothetical protein n=1 Tax=Streptomyces sp. NPDC085944 TaxID=3154962 RepID=UPI00343B27BE